MKRLNLPPRHDISSKQLPVTFAFQRGNSAVIESTTSSAILPLPDLFAISYQMSLRSLSACVEART